MPCDVVEPSLVGGRVVPSLTPRSRASHARWVIETFGIAPWGKVVASLVLWCERPDGLECRCPNG